MYPRTARPGVHHPSWVERGRAVAPSEDPGRGDCAVGWATHGRTGQPTGRTLHARHPRPLPQAILCRAARQRVARPLAERPGRTGTEARCEPFVSKEDAKLFVSLATRHGLPAALVRGEVECTPAERPALATHASIGFTELAELYSQQRTGASARTVKDDMRSLRQHAVAYFGNTDVALVPRKASTRGSSVLGPDGHPMSGADFVQWLARREGFTASGKPSGKLISAKTLADIVGRACAVFQYAADDENPIILSNPLRSVKLSRPQEAERPHLEPAAYLALEDAIDPHFLPHLAFLVGPASAGARSPACRPATFASTPTPRASTSGSRVGRAPAH